MTDQATCLSHDLIRYRARKRDGRCFELAALTLLRTQEKHPSTKWRLVHGEVNGPKGSRVEHAWLERQDDVYDAVTDSFYGKAHYAKKFDATAKVFYSVSEMSKRLVRTGHSGPWEVLQQRA